MCARMRPRREVAEVCSRSLALFRALDAELQPCRFWHVDVTASWFDGRLSNVELRPLENGHTFAAKRDARPLDTFTAYHRLAGSIGPLLSELDIRHGSITIPVREGVVKELVLTLRFRSGEPMRIWMPPPTPSLSVAGG